MNKVVLYNIPLFMVNNLGNSKKKTITLSEE